MKSSPSNPQYSNFRVKTGRTLFFAFLVWCSLLATTPCLGQETNVEWTPNEEDAKGTGPLPLSQNQRQQLLQLEQAIVNSPDPSATLQQVAQTNNMSPQDLAEMLERNHRDMQQQGGVAGGGARPGNSLVIQMGKKMRNLIAYLAAMVISSARKNPRHFGLVTVTTLFLFYVMISAPRTGMVMSTRRGLLSKGHSTVWHPPTSYINRLLSEGSSSNFLAKRAISAALEKKNLDLNVEHDVSQDGVEWHKLGRKSDMVQAVSAQLTIDVTEFMPDDDEEDADADSDSKEQNQQSRMEEASELVFDTAASVMSSRRLSEFVEQPKSFRFQNSQGNRQKYAFMVVKKMGDWGRYGLQPLKVSRQQEDSHETRLIFSTLRGGHFDGEIAISVKLDKNKILVTTSLAVPKKGKKVKKQLAQHIVSTLANSVAKSTLTRARQTMARQSQSSRYRNKVKDRAVEKRHVRFEAEKKQEEMARDRKRKWQRQNRDVGRYRPSGRRMQSPNNC